MASLLFVLIILPQKHLFKVTSGLMTEKMKEKRNKKRNNAFVPLHFVCAPETSLVCKAAVTAQIADGTHLVWMLTVSSSVVLLLLDSLMLVQDIS